jgi:hypothetical protein
MFTKTIMMIFLGMLTSCSTSYFISVRQDGSAKVNTDKDYDLTVIKRYYKSNIISNIDTFNSLDRRVSFVISDIDSLGNYLPFHPPGFFRFNMKEDTLTITDGHTNAFRDNHWSCCAVYMSLKFDKEIQSIESVNRVVRKKDEKTVLIKKSRKQLIRGKKKVNVKIKIKK